MLDIVFLTDAVEAGSRGGAETQMLRIATTLKRRGWKVGILTMLPAEGYKEENQAAGMPLVVCEHERPLLPIRMAYRMTRQLRRWKPRVLVSFNYHADVMGRVCGNLAGVPSIVASLRTVHVKTPVREMIYRFTEPLVDLTVSNSKAGVSYMVSRRILTQKKTAVIPNGIIAGDYPSPISREEARAEFEVPPGAFFWLAVGNLRPAKDYPTLLEAAERCATVSSDFRLYIAGGGESLEEMRAEVDRRGLKGIVHFLGIRFDVPRLLRACDALVLSSAWEGLPNTVMEAMASGLPVVATDVGGVRELIVEGETGFIVPSRDPLALADRMLDLMPLPEAKRTAMGDSGRQRILTHFDNDRVVDQWEERFRELIPKPEGRPLTLDPAFVISLDFELLWGMRDKRTIETYGDHILGEREAIPAMLQLFRKYDVKATWAAVGMTMFDRRKDLLEYLPEVRPTYERHGLDPYAALQEIGDDEKSDPYHYGLSLVRQILDCEGMELGSHTFSHFYCLEKGQDSSQFRADLEASVAATERLSERPISFVFPRNQFNSEYLSVCSASGFEVFRGNEHSWIYRESMEADQSLLRRGARLVDNYVDVTGHHGFTPSIESRMINCPSSRFLRPYSHELSMVEGLRQRRIRGAMERAAREGQSFHLWWHPHNFGVNLKENLHSLEALLRFHADLRERYGVVPMTMGDVGRMLKAGRVHPLVREAGA